MAEVLGIIAGGAGLASLAMHILDNVNKIREMYTAIRDAPAEFQSLLDEIELFGHVLSLFALNNPPLDPGHAFASAQNQVLRHCQSLHDELHPVLMQIATALKGRRRNVSWSSVKSVFQRKKVDQMLMKLERAKSTLGLTQLYAPHLLWSVANSS